MSGEPRLVGFLCRWCSHEAADAAGRRRLPLPPGLRVVRVPCAGRVSPAQVLGAFRAGADGVLVLACHPGDCHYRTGNDLARTRAAVLRRVLAPLGIEPERLTFGHAGAAEAEPLAAAVAAAAERVGRLGPLRRRGEE